MAAVLKVECEGEIRRMLFESAPQFLAVHAALEELWPGCSPGRATYQDDEGDACTLSEASFTDFLATPGDATGRRVLRLRLPAPATGSLPERSLQLPSKQAGQAEPAEPTSEAEDEMLSNVLGPWQHVDLETDAAEVADPKKEVPADTCDGPAAAAAAVPATQEEQEEDGEVEEDGAVADVADDSDESFIDVASLLEGAAGEDNAAAVDVAGTAGLAGDLGEEEPTEGSELLPTSPPDTASLAASFAPMELEKELEGAAGEDNSAASEVAGAAGLAGEEAAEATNAREEDMAEAAAASDLREEEPTEGSELPPTSLPEPASLAASFAPMELETEPEEVAVPELVAVEEAPVPDSTRTLAGGDPIIVEVGELRPCGALAETPADEPHVGTEEEQGEVHADADAKPSAEHGNGEAVSDVDPATALEPWEKTSVVFAAFDADGNGHLDYSECCELLHFAAAPPMPWCLFKVFCCRLGANPNVGLSFEDLSRLYLRFDDALERDFQAARRKLAGEEPQRQEAKSHSRPDSRRQMARRQDPNPWRAVGLAAATPLAIAAAPLLALPAALAAAQLGGRRFRCCHHGYCSHHWQ